MCDFTNACVPHPDGKVARVPAWTMRCNVQTPDAGPFNVLDLEWMFVAERKSHFKVAAFSKDRLNDFLDGEADQGCTLINTESKADKRTPGVITDLTGSCKYGCFAKVASKEKAKLPLTNVKGPRSKIIMGQSVKKGCCYNFFIKEYSKVPDVFFIKYPCKVHEEHQHPCRSMLHMDADGQNVHEGLTLHVRHTEEIEQFIVARLKAGCCVKTILKGVPALSCLIIVFHSQLAVHHTGIAFPV